MSVAPGPVPATIELGSPLADVSLLPSCPATYEAVARSYRPRDARVRRALAVADLTAVLTAFFTVLGPQITTAADLAWSLLPLPGWMLLFRAYGLYEADIKRFNRGVLRDLPDVVHASLMGSVVFWLYTRATPLPVVDGGALLAFAGVAASAILALRVAARRMTRRVLGPERVVIVGDSVSIPLLARKLQSHREYDVDLVGVVSSAASTAIGAAPLLGHPARLDLADVAERHRVDRVILAGTDAIDGTLADVVRRAHRLGLKVDYLPHPLDVVGAGVEVDDIEGVTVFGLYPPVLCRSSRCLKRTMDVLGAVALLVGTAPLMLATAVAVKLDSRGPVLFRHERIGRGGRRFRVAKFRTMVDGAESMAEQLQDLSRDPHWLLLDQDPRITRVGRLLRVSSLDELPQLWSVLKGDMSLVGPRPLVEAEDRQITGWGRGRLDLTPGLTGLWQVLGRTSIPFEEMIKLDYIYVTNWSAWRDVQLLLRTVLVVLSRRGAN
jgi:exopolysaccharide biosynthesis polyprenyl glycosylphosphotransferase